MSKLTLTLVLGTSWFVAVCLGSSFLHAQQAEAQAEAMHSLGELDWIVGEWSATEDQAEIELNAKRENSYLIVTFTARRDGEVLQHGTQRIAWDPAASRPRSWTFNDDGSFSEAYWKKEKDVWVVYSNGVEADGHKIKSVHLWTPEGNDLCWFKSLQGQIDDQPVEDLVLKFSRRELKNSVPAATDNDQR